MGKIYLFYGEEKYDLEQAVIKIKKQFNNLENGINLFYINSENVDNLENISSSITFFGDEKLIIMKDLNLKFDAEILNANKDNNITYIIIEDTIDKRTTCYKTLSKIAEIKEFKYMDSKQIPIYIKEILKKYNISIDNETAQYMCEMCGEDKTNLLNELKKIVSYLNNEENKVTKEIIDKVCSKTLNAKIFDMLDLILQREHVKGINMLEELLLQKEPIVKIYIMLYKQIKQMYLIKLLEKQGDRNIDKTLSMHPFTFKKLSYSVKKYNEKQLKQILNLFDEYDEKTKIGEMDFEIGLKKIICSI